MGGDLDLKKVFIRRGKKNELENTPEELHIALLCYTLEYPSSPSETPFYRIFNNACRALESPKEWREFKYQSFYILLYLSIINLNGNPDKDDSKFTRLYRGLGSTFLDVKV